ncbi:MAG: arsenic efflux protein, partial [Chromatiaceae bacterium]|nr:arsenic efflux protein [Chromatiaceae bacterium]
AAALGEAYLAVTVFVAGTLFLVMGAERLFKGDLGVLLERYRAWQVPMTALLGVFPGCGGAIVAVTQFSRGYLSFGAVVATLTATMGDAVFLLLAQQPDTALLVLGLSLAVAVPSGYLVDWIHGARFMRRAPPPQLPRASTPAPMRWSLADGLWLALLGPGLALGLLAAFQIEAGMLVLPWSGERIDPALLLGVTGAALSLGLWVLNGVAGERPCSDGACTLAPRPLARAVIDDTNAISAWVILAFVGYEVAVGASGFELGSALAVWAPLMPAMAIVVGFIPGCGPQIVVTSLYLSGAVPLSAQLGNAIANDGDALLPAIAVAPKAALLASLYSGIPAFLVAYGWFFFVEKSALV